VSVLTLETRQFEQAYDLRLVPLREQEEDFCAGLADRLMYADEVNVTALNAYARMMRAGGKGTRGVLTILGYELGSGLDVTEMSTGQRVAAAKAGTTIEAEHTFLCGVDDVADNSDTRRGEPAVHAELTGYFTRLRRFGSPQKLGVDLTFNGGIMLEKAAQSLYLDIDAKTVPAENKMLAMQILNRNLFLTGEGQAKDMVPPKDLEAAEEEKLRQTLLLKTALYTFVLPLQFGAATGGASRDELECFTEYGTNAGQAFQLTDDLLGMFGNQRQIGKPVDSDLKEDKATILMHRALHAATPADKATLLEAKGNPQLTVSGFMESRRIIERTGARQSVEDDAMMYARQARHNLQDMPPRFRRKHIAILGSIATQSATRTK
jgi:geranylgeranyl diphosphate synthase, type I